MERSSVPSRARRAAHTRLAAVFVAGLALLAGAAAGNAAPCNWPSVQDQLAQAHAIPGSAFEQLILNHQDFGALRSEEACDSLSIPPWLRALYHKNHAHDKFSKDDPTGGYPLVLNEVFEWMMTHQDLKPG